MKLLGHLLDELEQVSAQAAAAGWEALPELCARRGALAGELAAHPHRNEASNEQLRRIFEAGDALEARIRAWRAEWAEQAGVLEGQSQLAHSLSAAFAAPEGEDRARL